MKIEEELMARADAVADGFMATALAALGEDARAFTEGDISAMRGAFATGWLTGYEAALEDSDVRA